MGLFNRKKNAAPTPTQEKIDAAAAAVKEAASAVSADVTEKAGSAVEAAMHQVDDVMQVMAEKTKDFVQGSMEPVAAEAAPAGEEAPAEEAPAEEPAREGAPSCGDPEGTNELTEKEKGTVYQVRMNYHAGYGVYKEWPNGGMTIHSGIGWFHPFGPSEYYGVANIPGNFCEEAKQFPLENYFTEDWMKNFETDLFCIYRLADGDIYVWDGMFAVRGLDPHKCIVYNSEYTRQDVIVNVVVGGTGRYEGARGLLIGTTEGGGKTQVCGKMPDGSDLELPETIMKDLQGYIRFPEKD